VVGPPKFHPQRYEHNKRCRRLCRADPGTRGPAAARARAAAVASGACGGVPDSNLGAPAGGMGTAGRLPSLAAVSRLAGGRVGGWVVGIGCMAMRPGWGG
jgi:hypothetical protein